MGQNKVCVFSILAASQVSESTSTMDEDHQAMDDEVRVIKNVVVMGIIVNFGNSLSRSPDLKKF